MGGEGGILAMVLVFYGYGNACHEGTEYFYFLENCFAGNFPGERVLWSYNERTLAPVSQLNWPWAERGSCVWGCVQVYVTQARFALSPL